MEYRSLGSTGLRVSAIAFGGAPAGLANYLSPYDPDDPAQAEQVIAAVGRALELGITYFDTALSYGQGRSERFFGEARRRAGPLAAGMLLATKVPGGRRTYEGVLESVETSLRNLAVETIDMPQIAYNILHQDAYNLLVSAGPIVEAKARGMGVVTMRSLSSGNVDLVQRKVHRLDLEALHQRYV